MASAAALVATTNRRVTFATENDIHRFKSHQAPSTSLAPPPSPKLTSPKLVSHGSFRSNASKRRSRSGSFDLLAEIQAVFEKNLVKEWGSHDKFKGLARDFLAVAIGFSTACRISDYTLNRSQTAHLAMDLSNHLQTTDVLLILDSQSHTLFVVHTQILNNRLQSFPQGSETVFCRVDHGVPHVIETDDFGFLADAFRQVKNMLTQSNRQILQTSDFGWSSIDLAYRMITFGDWLLNHPVCYVVEPGLGQGSTDISKLMDDEQTCWNLQLQADGNEPENDHLFEICKVPALLFPDHPEWAPGSPELSSEKPRSVNMLQDRVQNQMTERLDASEMAMSLWSDLTCSCDGPHSF